MIRGRGGKEEREECEIICIPRINLDPASNVIVDPHVHKGTIHQGAELVRAITEIEGKK